MKKVLLILFYITFSLKISAQQNDLLTLVLPTEYKYFSHPTQLDNTDEPIHGKYFFSNNKETFVFDLDGTLISTLPFMTQRRPLGNRIIHNSKEGSLIFNMDTKETMKTVYREIRACGHDYFQGNTTTYKNQLFTWNDPTVILESANGIDFDIHKNYIKKTNDDYNRPTIYTIYNLKGDSLFTTTDCTLLLISGQHGIFKKMYGSEKTKIVNRHGKILAQLSDDDYVEDIGTGFRIFNRNDDSYFDYEGNIIQGSVLAKTKHKNVMEIRNEDNSKKGLHFKAQEKSTDILFNSFVYNPEYITTFTEDKNRYYSYSGKLLYKTNNTNARKLIINKYVFEYKKCGIFDTENNLIVSKDFTNTCKDCSCNGGVFDYQNEEYFWIKNKENHLFIWNKNQKLIQSFTDDEYKSVSQVCGHLILYKRQDRLKAAGLVNLKNKKLIIPHQYVYIYENKYEENDKKEYIILQKVGGFSLYHIPTKQTLLEGYGQICFISKNLVVTQKDNLYGLAKLKK